MRRDLDFLYQKAMRSIDKAFMNEVFMLLIEESRFEDAMKLDQRIDNLMVHGDETSIFTYTPTQSKFDFLIGDSLMGENWYRNR